MKLRFTLLLCLLAILLTTEVRAQDTVIVETLNFNDITKRRGTYTFPDGSEEYRKILMLYTLKCDPQTTADGFDCGEWDYLTYNQIYDHNATYDSTYRSHPSFLVNGAERESFSYTSEEVYDYHQLELTGIEHQSTNSLNVAELGDGSTSVEYPLKGSETGGKTYVLLTQVELLDAGLTAGPITGLALNVSSLGDLSGDQRVRIQITNSLEDNIEEVDLSRANFFDMYHYIEDIDQTGWQDFQFAQPYNWNGASNLLIAISTENRGEVEGVELTADTENRKTLHSDGPGYTLDFNQNGQFVNLGRDVQISGNAPRTIEAWAYTESFNGGGIFQAGSTGSTSRDFSFRTMGTDNRWRVQLWGTDFDLTLPGSKGSWHHYAIVYDGNSCRVYYDGQLIQSVNVNLNTGENDLWIGRWAGSYFRGKIDDVRVWDRALTSSVIQDWMSRRIDASHPHYDNLIGYYPFNEGDGLFVNDHSPAGQQQGTLNGLPWWSAQNGSERFNDFVLGDNRPDIRLEQGDYVSQDVSTTVIESALKRPVLLEKFDNPATGKIIPDDSPVLPSNPTSADIVWESGGYAYTYDEQGNAIDSATIDVDETLQQEIREWYSPTVVYEIGRFITPYGINLDLGPEGFRWIYDVTDYAGLLKGEVDLSAGNNQELIDLKFMFIKGTPPREVKHIKQIWGPRRSYSYRALDDDTRLNATTLKVRPDASQFKVKTRITGHGHNSNTGNYPHCCEWRDNTHFLSVNGNQAAAWKIWQATECANNPVYPQGGTWPGAREGWCPGDVVKEGEIDITDMVSGGEVTLDYDITPVPLDNQGMGNGNYVMSMQFIQYGDAASQRDAEIYELLAPSDAQYNSRFNPMCRDAQIVVRNNGIDPITDLEVRYWVKGGSPRTYTWEGNLAPRDRTIVFLPLGESFWAGDSDDPRFYAEVVSVNGADDMNAENDRISSSYETPVVFTEPVRVELRTNNRPFDNTLTIHDVDGNEVGRLSSLQANQTYTLALNFNPGCYTLDLLDTGNDGLSYWAFPNQGSGYLRIIRQSDGAVLYDFEPEFGRNLIFSFGVDDLTDLTPTDIDHKGISIFPNPASDGLQVDLTGFGDEEIQLSITDMLGKTYQVLNYRGNGSIQIPLHNLPAGSYLLSVVGEKSELRERFAVQR